MTTMDIASINRFFFAVPADVEKCGNDGWISDPSTTQCYFVRTRSTYLQIKFNLNLCCGSAIVLTLLFMIKIFCFCSSGVICTKFLSLFMVFLLRIQHSTFRNIAVKIAQKLLTNFGC